jgi:hypothetical protein
MSVRKPPPKTTRGRNRSLVDPKQSEFGIIWRTLSPHSGSGPAMSSVSTDGFATSSGSMNARRWS